MSDVEWRYGGEISPHHIEAFEAEFAVQLPDSFEEVARQYNGAIPFPGSVEFPHPYSPRGRDVIGLGELFSFVPDEDGISPIAEINHRYHEAYPGYIVFSEAGNGWHFAFEYRPGKEGRSVVLFLFENMSTSGCLEVAHSFDELVAGFVTGDDDEDEPSVLEA
ncbi:SMI1/KNR4 family protein [Methylobacterium sp. CM6246]